MAHVAVKLRCYPPPELQQTLAQWFGCVRKVYNLALGVRKENYELWKDQGKPTSFYWENYHSLATDYLQYWKKQFPFLKNTPAQSLQYSLRHLQQAFTNFYQKVQKTTGHPRFKNKYSDQAITFSNQSLTPQHFSITNNKWLEVNLPKTKELLRVRYHREFPRGRLLSTTLSRNKCGQYFISFSFEVRAKYILRESDQEPQEVLGVDVNSNPHTPFATAALTNKKWKFKVWGVVEAKQIRKLDKQVAVLQVVEAKLRKVFRNRKRQAAAKGEDPKLVTCKNLNKIRAKINRLYQRQNNIREQFTQWLSTFWAKNFKVTKFEDINFQEITAKGGEHKKSMNHNLLLLSPGRLRLLTINKAPLYGHEAFEVPKENTSIKCSRKSCGYINKNNRKGKVFCCLKCGYTKHADFNAGKNIAMSEAA